MKKSLIIAALMAATFSACNSIEETPKAVLQTEDAFVAPVITNKDSADKAHGHSHDATGTEPAAITVNQDSIDKGQGHSHDAPANQINPDQEHVHQH